MTLTIEPFARHTTDHTGIGFFVRKDGQTRGSVGLGKYFKFEYACNNAALALCFGPFCLCYISAFGNDIPAWMHSASSKGVL